MAFNPEVSALDQPSQAKGLPKSPLMSSPIEVRQKIWKFVLVFDEPILIKPHGRILSAPSRLRSGRQVKLDVAEQEEQHLSSQFALASTCRQVYLEVAPIYYGMNTFAASKFLGPFFDAIGHENVGAITSIAWNPFRARSRPTNQLYDAFIQLKGLRRVRFTGCCSDWRARFNTVHSLRDLRTLLELHQSREYRDGLCRRPLRVLLRYRENSTRVAGDHVSEVRYENSN